MTLQLLLVLVCLFADHAAHSYFLLPDELDDGLKVPFVHPLYFINCIMKSRQVLKYTFLKFPVVIR